MTLESGEKIKLLDEYTEILKHDLLFLMAEARKHKFENTMNHKIITIKQELDRVIKEKMRLSRIYHGNINNSMALTVPTG